MEKARKQDKLRGVTLKEICRVDEYTALVREDTEENVLGDQSKQLDGDKRLLENRETRQKTVEQSKNLIGRRQTAVWQVATNHKHGRMRADSGNVHFHM